MSKEAMTLAIVALEGIHPGNMTPMAEEAWNKAITALREALADQPAQTATYTCGVCGVSMQMEQPAQQEPVAIDRIIECAKRLVEHADFRLGGALSQDSKAKDIPSRAVSQVKARHLAALRDALANTSPPAQRTWVGLTQDEFRDFASTLEYATVGLIRAIEAKLKAENT